MGVWQACHVLLCRFDCAHATGLSWKVCCAEAFSRCGWCSESCRSCNWIAGRVRRRSPTPWASPRRRFAGSRSAIDEAAWPVPCLRDRGLGGGGAHGLGQAADHRHGLQRASPWGGAVDGAPDRGARGEAEVGAAGGPRDHSDPAAKPRPQAVAGKTCGAWLS